MPSIEEFIALTTVLCWTISVQLLKLHPNVSGHWLALLLMGPDPGSRPFDSQVTKEKKLVFFVWPDNNIKKGGRVFLDRLLRNR